MAKKSKVEQNNRRREIVAKHRVRREELKRTLRLTRPGDAEHDAARAELGAMPRDASATRVRNRDAVDGRPRGYLRKFGVSRVRLRAMAHDGQLPGVVKSSW